MCVVLMWMDVILVWWWVGSIMVGFWTYTKEIAGLTSGRVAIKYLQLGWVTVCGQVNHISI